MSDSVFVVHGRNTAARDAVFTFLRAIGLKPIEWDQAVARTGSGSPYVGEVLDLAFREGQAVVVLLTPDDVAYLRTEYAHGDDDPEATPRGQARPNVLFEAGMAFGRDPKRTILIEMGDVRPFSDVGGRHVIRMSNAPETRRSIASRLETAGCSVDLSGTDWLSAGDLTPPSRPGKGLPLGRRLPSADRHGPSVDGRWLTSGGSRFDKVRITNNGAMPLFDVNLVVPEELQEHIELHNDEPVSKLPAGKSFTIPAWTSRKTMGASGPAQFELPVTAKMDDGTPFKQEVFFDIME